MIQSVRIPTLVLVVGLSFLRHEVIAQNATVNSVASDYDRAITSNVSNSELIESDNPIALFNFGLYQYNRGNLMDAEYYFNLATEKDPDFAEPYLYLARVKIREKNFNDAIRLGQMAVEKNEALVPAHLDLFLCYSRLEKKPEANQHLLQAAKLEPETISRTASRLITEQDDLYGALFFFEKVHSVAPTNLLNSLNYAKALMILGRAHKAEKILEIAYQASDPSDENFELLYTMYFGRLLEHGKYDFILNMASEKVDVGFGCQYMYKALTYYLLGDERQFEENANLYFRYKDHDKPESLVAWAKSHISD